MTTLREIQASEKLGWDILFLHESDYFLVLWNIHRLIINVYYSAFNSFLLIFLSG